MNGKELAHALLAELDKKKNRRVKVPVTWETLEELFRDVLDPKPVEEDVIPFYAPPEIPPEYPKLKVRYGKEIDFKAQTPEKVMAMMNTERDLSAQAWIVVNSAKEEEPFHAGGWLTMFPPNVPPERMRGQSLQSVIEKLKADGVTEWKPARKTGAA
jgi:hypothetical protein